MKNTIIAVGLIASTINGAFAFAPNGCELQRKQYPSNWNDTSKETPLFRCLSHYGVTIHIKIGATDEKGRTLISLVPEADSGQESQSGVLRIWLDEEQARRLREGKYFATILRKEDSCWVRGGLSSDTVFFMDNTNPPADDEKEAGSFYNKAPRFSVFGRDAYYCDAIGH